MMEQINENNFNTLVTLQYNYNILFLSFYNTLAIMIYKNNQNILCSIYIISYIFVVIKREGGDRPLGLFLGLNHHFVIDKKIFNDAACENCISSL